MAFIDIGDNTPEELVLIPAGTETKLRIIGYITQEEDGETKYIRVDKNGNPYFMPIYEPADEPMADELTDYIPLPHENMTPREKSKAAFKIQTWEACFDLVDNDSGDFAGSIGAEGDAILGTRTNKRSQEDENYVKKYL